MIKKLYLKLFKPYVYVIQKNSFLGDFSEKIKVESVKENGIINKNKFYLFSEVYLFEYFAKKEISKTSLKYEEQNIQLAQKLKAIGLIRNNYEYIQVLEDGEASELYQKYQEMN